jgi:hypothetical protein
MDEFKNVDWDNIDLKEIAGATITLPDGRLQYVELPMICWYGWHFMHDVLKMHPNELILRVFESIEEAGSTPEEFDEDFQFALGQHIAQFNIAYSQNLGTK